MFRIADVVQAYFASNGPEGVVSAYLFGSHARERSHSESDVDVGVLLDYGTFPGRAERSSLVAPLGSELIAATHCNDVDVVILNDAPPELAAAIVTRGRRLYCADSAADHAFVRTALLLHADIQPFLRRTRKLKLEAML